MTVLLILLLMLLCNYFLNNTALSISLKNWRSSSLIVNSYFVVFVPFLFILKCNAQCLTEYFMPLLEGKSCRSQKSRSSSLDGKIFRGKKRKNCLLVKGSHFSSPYLFIASLILHNPRHYSIQPI